MERADIESLVRGCIEGDRRAQHALFRAYRSVVLSLVWRVLGPQPRADIEDAVQQVFVALFRSLGRFRGESSFDTWVYRIGTRVCVTRIRDKYRRKARFFGPNSSGEVDCVADSTFSPEARAQRRETVEQVYAALERLPAQRRVVFVLADIEGKTIEEIGAIVEKPIGTVKSRLFRARKELANHLRPLIED